MPDAEFGMRFNGSCCQDPPVPPALGTLFQHSCLFGSSDDNVPDTTPTLAEVMEEDWDDAKTDIETCHTGDCSDETAWTQPLQGAAQGGIQNWNVCPDDEDFSLCQEPGPHGSDTGERWIINSHAGISGQLFQRKCIATTTPDWDIDTNARLLSNVYGVYMAVSAGTDLSTEAGIAKLKFYYKAAQDNGLINWDGDYRRDINWEYDGVTLNHDCTTSTLANSAITIAYGSFKLSDGPVTGILKPVLDATATVDSTITPTMDDTERDVTITAPCTHTIAAGHDQLYIAFYKAAPCLLAEPFSTFIGAGGKDYGIKEDLYLNGTMFLKRLEQLDSSDNVKRINQLPSIYAGPLSP